VSDPASPDQLSGALIQVFAKYPHPGTVKTRLLPSLGVEKTTALYRELLERQLDLVTSMPDILSAELVGTESEDAEYFQYCLTKWSRLRFRRQVDGDLGDRMSAALASAAHQGGAILQVGADCPALTQTHLYNALQSLQGGDDVVFIPADDGGYVLAGYRRFFPGLFHRIDWGTDRVLTQCTNRLTSLGLRFSLLPVLWDLDRPEDLPRYQQIRKQSTTD